MEVETQKPIGIKLAKKRASLLEEMLKNQYYGSQNTSPRSSTSQGGSPLKKHAIYKAVTSLEKNKDKMIYKKAYKAIIEQNLDLIDEVINLLKQNEKNINSPLKTNSMDDQALIHLVAETIDPNDVVMKYIVEQKGADIRLQDSFGNNALHLACRSGKLETVKYLQIKGLDLFQRNKIGDYSVIFATFSGNLELVKYLYNNNVPLELCNLEDKSALDIARERNFDQIFDFFFEISKKS